MALHLMLLIHLLSIQQPLFLLLQTLRQLCFALLKPLSCVNFSLLANVLQAAHALRSLFRLLCDSCYYFFKLGFKFVFDCGSSVYFLCSTAHYDELESPAPKHWR